MRESKINELQRVGIIDKQKNLVPVFKQERMNYEQPSAMLTRTRSINLLYGGRNARVISKDKPRG